MKKLIGICLLLLSITKISIAQVTDWNAVARIIYKNCSSCHHSGGIGPFPLMSFQDAELHSGAIPYVVNLRLMPPWPADPNYRHFAYEAVLDSSEIAAINAWINDGTLEGDTSLAPDPPVFSQPGSLLDTISMTLMIPPYTLLFNTDEYRYFAFHSGFTDTVYVSKIEVIPGLSSYVHHADIHYDLTGTSYNLDSLSPLPGFTSGIISNYYMNAWQSGGNIVSYPDGWGIMVPPGADFVFEVHYGPGGQGLTDTTKMNLQFITNPVNVRKINVGWLLNNPIPSQGPLVIPPNVITTFNQLSAPMPVDRSLISISPHMHKLGHSYKVWYKDLAGDSVPLVDIPHWDYHWQKYYTFQSIQKIPAGAQLYSIASYDNTVNNMHNPNNPPITVTYGPTTNDEMLMTYFIWADYQPGDENIILDSTLVTSVEQNIHIPTNTFAIYPNPAGDYFYTDFFPGIKTRVDLSILNSMGQEVKSFSFITDHLQEKIDVATLPPGMYFINFRTEKESAVKKLIISE